MDKFQKPKKVVNPLHKRKRPIKAYKDMDFINSVDARPLRILAEYMEPQKRLKELNVENTIVFFGSARLKSQDDAKRELNASKRSGNPTKIATSESALQMSKYYEDAVELARLLTVWSQKTYGKGPNRFIICSGGGPGIMEAANRGAHKAKGESMGLNISLPFETNSNPYITPELNFEFHYFFTRKYWFSYLAKALVIFPGGFGTLDELAEVLTLVQTQKIKRKIPILIYGSEFWNSVINLKELANRGTIDHNDLKLIHFSDTPEDAFSFIVKKLKEFKYA